VASPKSPIGLVGILKAVEQHVIDDPIMAGAISAACFREQIGRIRHALHAAGHHDLGRTGTDDVMGQHRGFHPGAADLVDGGGAGRVGQSRAAGGLSCRGLALSGRQHTAHEDLVDSLRRKPGAFERGGDHMGAELVGAERRKVTHEAAKGRAGGGDDDNGIGGCGHERPPSGRGLMRLQISYDAVQNSATDHADDNYT
jgi:hypothetical protein